MFSALYLGAVVILQGGPGQLYGFAQLVLDVLPLGKNREQVSLNQAEPFSSAGGDKTNTRLPKTLERRSEEVF